MDSNRREHQAVEADEDRWLAELVAGDCFDFLRPLLKELDKKLDVRLVRTLADAVVAIVRHRNRPQALLLSELGSVIAGPKHAPAGTKRLANLVHSDKWQAEELQDHLEDEGTLLMLEESRRVSEGRALCILDSSVEEKPESTKLEGLSPGRSAKARRLARPRPKLGKGYYRGKPGPPIVVPGFEWTSVLVTGWAGREERRPVALGAWHWYAKPLEGESPTTSAVVRQREQEAAWSVLARVSAAWGKDKLLHVWDRGFSGAPWLGQAMEAGLAFVVRWKKGNKLRPAEASSVGDPTASPYQQDQDGVAAWKLTRGLKNWGTRKLANPRNPQRPITVSFAAREVRLPHRDEPLWLVVARLGKDAERQRGSKEPWRLLTNQPVRTAEACWRIVVAYGARWAIEQEQRFGKSELGIESVRVRSWEPRAKLLAIAALAYSFLVQLLGQGTGKIVAALLRWAHRTGRQAREAWRSLYRLRAALANLWNKHPPSFRGIP